MALLLAVIKENKCARCGGFIEPQWETVKRGEKTIGVALPALLTKSGEYVDGPFHLVCLNETLKEIKRAKVN